MKGFCFATMALLCITSCSSPQAIDIVNRMETREKLAQKINISFRSWCDNEPPCPDLTEINDTLKAVLREENFNGVTLFSSNLVSLEQSARLIQDIRTSAPETSPVGFFIAVDNEGGSVFRFPRSQATAFAGNMSLGAVYAATQDPDAAETTGKILARELKSIGFNVNFAPVVDVQINPDNPVINVRSFGENPDTVSLLGEYTAKGMASEGIISIFKHFPGHGDTTIDSHYGIPVVMKSRDEIYKIERKPYLHAIRDTIAPDMIMAAHIQFPALDQTTLHADLSGEDIIAPATLSRKIMTGLLREDLGYRGVTMTDALDMQAISNHFSPYERIKYAFKAGIDIALMPLPDLKTPADIDELKSILDRLVLDVESGELDINEIEQSVARIIALKLRYGITPPFSTPSRIQNSIGNTASRKTEQDLAEAALTLVTNQNRQNKDDPILPLFKDTVTKIHIFGSKQEHIDALSAELGKREFKTSSSLYSAVPTSLTNPANTADIVMFTQASTKATPATKESTLIRQLMSTAKAEGKGIIFLSLRAPYDIALYDDIADATLCLYNENGYVNGVHTGPAFKAAVRVITGEITPKGALPVSIPITGTKTIRYKIGHGLSFQDRSS